MPLSDAERKMVRETLAEQTCLEHEAVLRQELSGYGETFEFANVAVVGAIVLAAIVCVGLFLQFGLRTIIEVYSGSSLTESKSSPFNPEQFRSSAPARGDQYLQPGAKVSLWSSKTDYVVVVKGDITWQQYLKTGDIDTAAYKENIWDQEMEVNLPNLELVIVDRMEGILNQGQTTVRIRYGPSTFETGYVLSGHVVRPCYTEAERAILMKELAGNDPKATNAAVMK